MSKLYSVGELLIDFQSVGGAPLKDTSQFVKNAGGAPANVCVQAVKLGCKAAYLTKVGNDGFGEFLAETLKNEGVDMRFVLKSDKYDTSLAFVSFGKDGEREFCFFRKAAADLHISPEDFAGVDFKSGDVLEFGSVGLKTAEAQSAHEYLINKAEAAGALVCFDPNVRFNLWDSREELKKVILKFAPSADVIKVGGDELEFITGKRGKEAVRAMFAGKLKLLLVTEGGAGARAYLADGREFTCKGYKVKPVDTTGAGDSFFGAFIARLMQGGATRENLSLNGNLQEYLDFACRCGAYTTTGFGAIRAMGTEEQVNKAVK